ncbi:hypothetical protein N0V90_007129 [Kalmusia sp. IMI 367209]|nr:hypothetical protein N0V90_007129 [Kalmusia sp. IMI 367209]
MAKGPAVVIVARHGARLDAADKQWHLTSPTPYDPPLTYGGWAQGKALGLRIASLLHARENEKKEESKDDVDADLAPPNFDTLDTGKNGKSLNGTPSGVKKRKQKIIIHSSPFLRCVQTSTAIAAGISQFKPPPPTSTKLKVPQPSKEKSPLSGSLLTSPAVQPVRGREPKRSQQELAANGFTAGWLRLTNPEVNSKPYVGPEKVLLRIDAFLGEWLSPDYYEDITPPPNSTMMVAGAKADLLRRSDYVEAPPKAPSSQGHFPGGWARSNTPAAVNGRANSRKNTGDVPFAAMGSLAQALPHRERSSSQGSLTRQRSRSQDPHGPVELTAPHKLHSHLYDAPSPSYAVSPSDPIPRGYFNHARDACVKVDFQWDSMREPQLWGDGGEFGDEWSTMHKRFRRGLAGMMQWYREHGTKNTPPQDLFPGFTFSERTSGPKPTAVNSVPKVNGEEEDEEELVLVLVTHGAGCNALLGAISNQPVLMDVGLAALSMAVVRDVPRRSSSTIYARRSSVVDPGMADTYEMKLLASVDHLRPGVDPSKLPQAQSPATLASPSVDYRRRLKTSNTSTPINQIDSPSSLDSPSVRGWNSSLGSVRRTSTQGSGSNIWSSNTSGSASPSASSGLWGSSLRSISFNETPDGRASPGADMVEIFQNSHPKPTSNAIYTQAPPKTTPIPAVDGSTSPKSGPITGNGQVPPVNGNEDNEKHDEVAPLKSPRLPSAAGKTDAPGGGGLWAGAKTQTASYGLWGPPRLEEVYEHGRGPKRRWTMTERE